MGLKPVYRRVWARRGERPKAVVAHRYRWFYLCTFVEPETGEALSLLVDGVDTGVMSWALREFRGWLGEEEGVRLVFLPPYSPELQPVERVWPLVNEAVANRYFADLEALMEAVERRWLALQGDRELLRRRTLFHWWPGAKGSA